MCIRDSLLPYACLGVACAGLLYLVVSALFKAFGPQRITVSYTHLDVYKRQQMSRGAVLLTSRYRFTYLVVTFAALLTRVRYAGFARGEAVSYTHLLQDHGEISLPVANELRQRVYVLQMSLGE